MARLGVARRGSAGFERGMGEAGRGLGHSRHPEVGGGESRQGMGLAGPGVD